MTNQFIKTTRMKYYFQYYFQRYRTIGMRS